MPLTDMLIFSWRQPFPHAQESKPMQTGTELVGGRMTQYHVVIGLMLFQYSCPQLSNEKKDSVSEKLRHIFYKNLIWEMLMQK
jgi:hypothetical protein